MSFNNWIKTPFEKSSFQFWRHFCLYAVSNAAFEIAQELLISFFNTSLTWKTLPFCLQLHLERYKTEQLLEILVMMPSSSCNYEESGCLLISIDKYKFI